MSNITHFALYHIIGDGMAITIQPVSNVGLLIDRAEKGDTLHALEDWAIHDPLVLRAEIKQQIAAGKFRRV